MDFSKSSFSLFIFDLDGTLIDSKADIAFGMNLALARMNMQPLPIARVAEFIGDGMQILVERALCEISGSEPDPLQVQNCMDLFKEEYGQHLLDQTRLYPHVLEVLDRLSWAKLAVVSNKPEGFSRQILEGLKIASRFGAIIGGDTTGTRKPDPAGIVKAMELCRAVPSESLMVGDSPVDIAAGKAAGTFTCGVAGGFRPRNQLESAGCDLLVNNLLDLAKIIATEE
jgi:phosphoglycolate phosphatase